jgi:hypothetical protein
MQQALAGQTITGVEDGLELTVRNTRPFTWLRQSTAPEPGQLGGTRFEGLSEIDGVENAGTEFMDTVFNELDEGDVGVVPNSDKSVYYVVKVSNRSSSSETGRKILYDELLRAPFFEGRSPYPELLGIQQQQMGMAWVQRLAEKYDVQWNRPPDENLRREF